ncbi:MAG: acyltransferase family protein [Pacificimonas sp.]
MIARPSPALTGYRPEVDGLRTVAVVPVILFHAGVELFSGGFVGVDVFFVISGYLITGILLREMKAGEFSIVQFYERRARRILPALFAVMAASLPFAWWLLIPGDYRDFSQSLVATVGFASNILFFLEADYFDQAAELKPLLHTWSLAVEEQFYLFFPLILLVLHRFGMRLIWIATIAILVGSFIAAERADASAAFYLILFRAWELMIGSMAAYAMMYRRAAPGKRLAEVLALLGLALIFYGIFAFDADTPFPGRWALPPTVGTALVILYAVPGTLTARLLSLRPLVLIGLASYSAYLWHQPVLVFMRHYLLGELTVPWMALGIGLTALLSFLSYRYVETPFRHRARFGRRAVFTWAAIGSVAFAAIGAAGHLAHGFPDRWPVTARQAENSNRSESPMSCFNRIHDAPGEDFICPVGAEDAAPAFAFIGDSHAPRYVELLDDLAREKGVGGIMAASSACPPLIGVYPERSPVWQDRCIRQTETMVERVREQRVETVFLMARWAYYSDGGYHGDDLSYLSLTPEPSRDRAISRRALVKGLTGAVSAFRAAGAKVVIVTQPPELTFAGPALFYRAARSGDPAAVFDAARVPLEKHRRLMTFADGLLAGLARKDGVSILDTQSAFCNANGCAAGDAGGSWYTDADHLGLYGAARTRTAFAPLFDSIE